jgi:hypothetical protein
VGRASSRQRGWHAPMHVRTQALRTRIHAQPSCKAGTAWRAGSTWFTALCATTSSTRALSEVPRSSCHASDARYHSSLRRHMLRQDMPPAGHEC